MKLKVDFKHRERRYLVDDVRVIARLTAELAARHPLREYALKTTYLDVPGGSWSLSAPQIKAKSKKQRARLRRLAAERDVRKVRVRVYDPVDYDHEERPSAVGVTTVIPCVVCLRKHAVDQPWLEVKRRDNGVTTKHRQKMDAASMGVISLFETVCELRYNRQSYEWRGLRVTIDTNVRASVAGRVGERYLSPWVVEVKGNRGVPGWLAALLPKEAEGFSKSRWALGQWQGPAQEPDYVPDRVAVGVEALSRAVALALINEDAAEEGVPV